VIGPTGNLSNPTLGLIYLLMPALIWVVLARLRSRVVALWCLGSLLVSVSQLLPGLEPTLPGWFVAPAVTLATFAGELCGVQALRLDQGAPWRLRWMAAATLGFLLVYELCLHTQGRVTLRLAFVPLVYLLLVLQVVWWASRIARKQWSLGALAIVGSHLVQAISLSFILVELIHPRGGVLACPREGAAMSDTTEMLAAIGADVGFIGVALERSLRQWLEASASQARLEERQLLGNQLAHLDRQRGFGLVAASLAHELNQPLTAILASAQAARRGAAAERLGLDQNLELLDKIIFNTRRITGITERIRGFIRPSGLDSAPVDLELITREMLELMQPDLRRHGVRVTFPAVGEPILVQGDAIQLSQVVLNALRNAIEAVQLVPVRSLEIMLTRSASEAALCLRDSGPGLDPALADQVGTPYFTTKEQGLGLGLSISTAILQQHQGSLTLRNAEGGGACVDIRLPLLAEGGS